MEAVTSDPSHSGVFDLDLETAAAYAEKTGGKGGPGRHHTILSNAVGSAARVQPGRKGD